MAKLLTRCPVCEAALRVSELTCGNCRTQVRSLFDPCRFCSLPTEHLAFVETFLRCEGNLSRVEKELGVSYPTVRNKLTAALSALGFLNGAVGDDARVSPPEPEPISNRTPEEAAATRRRVLDALATGEMSAEEAADALRDLS